MGNQRAKRTLLLRLWGPVCSFDWLINADYYCKEAGFRWLGNAHSRKGKALGKRRSKNEASVNRGAVAITL